MAREVIRKTQINVPGGDPITAHIGSIASDVLLVEGNDKTVADELKDFTGATTEQTGQHGFVPAPSAGDTEKFLKSDGTWGTPSGGVSSVNGKTGNVTLAATDVGAISATQKGAASGIAELDSTGKVPSTQLPSYVDDVIEVVNYAALPVEGETGKIYVTLDNNKTYRWGGSAYVEISESLALGETSTTAFRGDQGKTAYDHSQDANRATTANTLGLYKFSSTAEGHISSVSTVTKADITNLGIPEADTTYTFTTGSVGSASAWSTNSPTTLSVSGDTLLIDPGTAASLTITPTNVVTSATKD